MMQNLTPAFQLHTTFIPGRGLQRAQCSARYGTRMSAATDELPSVLRDILRRKEDEVAAVKSTLASNEALSDVLAKRGTYEQKHRFRNVLNLPNKTLALIAEIKRRSPSKGELAILRNPTHISRVYHEAGADAISVLTDGPGFGGSLDDLSRVVKCEERIGDILTPPCPVLRKDFIIDEVQLAEAKLAGASAVLLIVSALGEARTAELRRAAAEFGLDALVEVHNKSELEQALAAGAEIVGVNNRNLNNFEEKLDTSTSLIEHIPENVISVAESGIRGCEDAWGFRDAGFNAILVGEALVKAYEYSGSTATGYSGGYNQARGLIKAFKAKGSTKFGRMSNAAFYGQGEGAKETLGELSI